MTCRRIRVPQFPRVAECSGEGIFIAWGSPHFCVLRREREQFPTSEDGSIRGRKQASKPFAQECSLASERNGIAGGIRAFEPGTGRCGAPGVSEHDEDPIASRIAFSAVLPRFGPHSADGHGQRQHAGPEEYEHEHACIRRSSCRFVPATGLFQRSHFAIHLHASEGGKGHDD